MTGMGFVKGGIRMTSLGMLALLANGASACRGHDCTLVGCDSGLTIRVQPPPTAPYRVEVVGGPTSARRVRNCGVESPCGDRFAFFQNLVTARATVEVIVGSDTTRREFTNITYLKTQPNGEHCGPTCLNAEGTFALGSPDRRPGVAAVAGRAVRGGGAGPGRTRDRPCPAGNRATLVRLRR